MWHGLGSGVGRGVAQQVSNVLPWGGVEWRTPGRTPLPNVLQLNRKTLAKATVSRQRHTVWKQFRPFIYKKMEWGSFLHCFQKQVQNSFIVSLLSGTEHLGMVALWIHSNAPIRIVRSQGRKSGLMLWNEINSLLEAMVRPKSNSGIGLHSTQQSLPPWTNEEISTIFCQDEAPKLSELKSFGRFRFRSPRSEILLCHWEHFVIPSEIHITEPRAGPQLY